jgi:hypothetical protein
MEKMELGSRQEKVLLWVAKNPKKHAKDIQLGINYPQYGNINTDVKKLTDYGFLTFIEEPSSEKRKRIVNKYSCTENGIYYALSKSSDSDIIKILETYRSIYPNLDFFYSEYERMGKEGFILWLRDFLIFVPMLGKNSAEEIISNMLLFYVNKFKESGRDERVRVINSAVKHFPSARKAVDELRSVLKEVDKGDEEND